MQIGRKIYYDPSGNVILDKGERQGAVVETSVEDDVLAFTVLSIRNPESYSVLDLEFGAYAQDFAVCNGYRINPTTQAVEFSYPDPNIPVEEAPFQPSLSEEIANLKAENEELKQAVAELRVLIN